MTTIRSFMTEDHRRCDDLFAEAEQAVSKGNLELALVAFGHFRSAMLAHFASEEKTLFPTFEAQTGMRQGPTQVMRMEHEQLRGLMDDAINALKTADAEEYLGQADTLVIMMQQHNMKEENMLYPMCDQHLTAELPAVLERLETELCD
ncbi:MAG: hemerythrin domain-containing protein [Gammaproteobacteria bacterium]|nr:hemerythrin domain-containing protein [Gammaproteobacteria bacterium]MBU1603342.1 hemerythrin domain-containing protein [Gammaproteobacteria bacterium]MBU2432862.1 hemerythrin domain-containing protein [Gammaproteobacteria bacterium]MBU2450105.1 hemerythrin domain-containing protein [Gammaproteobacteria bacterium]